MVEYASARALTINLLPATLIGMTKNNPFGEGELPELSLAVIEQLKAKGFNQSRIAELYGVSRQAVSWHLRTYNGTRTPRQQVLEANFPWKVSQEHERCSAQRRLREHGEYMATGGKGMSEDKLSRLRGFYKMLRDQNAVLEYDPSIPPIDGFASRGGFALRPRRKKDGDLLIRVNEYTDLSDEGRMIWRFPPREP